MSIVETTVIEPRLYTTPFKELAELGISSQWEYERYMRVSEAVGQSVALRELYRNKEAYEREFLQDEPVSCAYRYHHFPTGFYSEPTENELFRIESQIHPGERNGATIEGFRAYQDLIFDSKPGNVALWYSPAGSAGDQEPFDKLFFDSGRLYFGIKQQDGTSIHLNVKIDESRFPIQTLLDSLSKQEELSLLDYLQHPIATNQTLDELLWRMSSLFYAHIDNPAYISKRHSNNPKQHSMRDMLDEVSRQYYALQQQGGLQEASVDDEWLRLTRQKGTFTVDQNAIQHMYLSMVYAEAMRNGGSTVLYGCTTTSLFSLPNQPNLSFSQPPLLPFGLGSMYSTAARQPSSLSFSSNKKTKEACVTCPYCGNKKGNTFNSKEEEYTCGNEKCESNN
ncbi:hypothetical protein KC726_02915 [Candidatus Woesebacteria bacterium]|nr:hypothetical protein [Candidatus Woesebacteria bacterium]